MNEKTRGNSKSVIQKFRKSRISENSKIHKHRNPNDQKKKIKGKKSWKI